MHICINIKGAQRGDGSSPIPNLASHRRIVYTETQSQRAGKSKRRIRRRVERRKEAITAGAFSFFFFFGMYIGLPLVYIRTKQKPRRINVK
jgi:hypothetical protein